MEQNYCRRCGSPLTQNDAVAYNCENGHAIYSNPAPCVGIFLLDTSGKVVLSVRGIEPAKGSLDSIGGFIDGEESLEEALRREIKEETGLSPDQYSEPTYLISAPSTYAFGGENRSVLSSFFYARLNEGAEPRALDDVAELTLIAPEDLKAEEMWANDVRIAVATLQKTLGVVY